VTDFSQEMDFLATQLLCSRLCHDLIGPAGAVNAGIELLGDSFDRSDEAFALLDGSADQVTNRLKFFRIAFGSGGGGEDGRIAAGDLCTLMRSFLASSSVSLDWDSDPDAPSTLIAGHGKLLLNCMLVGVDSLPRGGVVEVRFVPLDGDCGFTMRAVGNRATLREGMFEALNGQLIEEKMNARNIQGHFTHCLTRETGVTLEISLGLDGEVRLAGVLPTT
jgi:histidine phosphotransferase ChpT